MKMMKLVYLLVVLALAGSVQAAIYNEDFTTDPGWTYQSGGDPTSTAPFWEDNATHGGIINGTYYRTGSTTYRPSYYYTDIATTMGQPVDETFDWTMSIDIYQEFSANGIYGPYIGLASDDFIGATTNPSEPTNWIGYRPYTSGNRVARFYCDVPGGLAYSALSAGGIYPSQEWYSVEVSFDSTTKDMDFRVVVGGSDVFTWSTNVTGSFSFSTFATWDYTNSSSRALTTQYLDNLQIIPEPATMVLLVLGSLAALRGKRRG